MALGEDIRLAREARGMSQKDLADAIGVTQIAISKIESGKTKKSRYLSEICAFLGVQLPASKVHQKTEKPSQALSQDDISWLATVFEEFVREAVGQEAASRWTELAGQALPELSRPVRSSRDRQNIVEEARLQGRLARLRSRRETS